ncbi:hypothetical protein KD144_017455 [Niallia circulans]|nr:hypothetical protein [Niallia circulans]MCB5238647.1 hypothetical protein [Niallia circulans]
MFKQKENREKTKKKEITGNDLASIINQAKKSSDFTSFSPSVKKRKSSSPITCL